MKSKKTTKSKKPAAKKTIAKKSTSKKSITKSPATYVDGFVLTIPKKFLGEYKKLTAVASKVWKEHGALQYVEAIGDDLNIKMGVPFTTLSGAGQNDLVIFSWISYKSKAHRDMVNKKVMKDKRIACDPSKMPFDCNKMTYGGFKIIESA